MNKHIPDLCYMPERSVMITQEQYNYLLPALRKHLSARRFADKKDEFFFIGTSGEIDNMRQRLKGLAWS